MNDVLKIKHQDSDLSLVFDDDGRVAYAYLLKGPDIVADVWLYNHGQPPNHPEWDDGADKMPFKNSAEFTTIDSFTPITDENEIEVQWIKDSSSNNTFYADLYIRKKLHARLRPFDKPGKCILAIKDSPVAQVL